jgi:secretion/DNA translocation related TadE-like protein
MKLRTRVESERGSVSIVVAAAVGMALVVTMGAADVGRALIARSRAEAAADLAALAAAQELAFPSGIDPEAFAADYAVRNGARLVSCSCAEGTSEAVVRVAVPARGFLLPIADRDVIGIARAVVDLPYLTTGWPFDTISIGSIRAWIVPSGATTTSATAVADASSEIRGHTKFPRL